MGGHGASPTSCSSEGGSTAPQRARRSGAGLPRRPHRDPSPGVLRAQHRQARVGGRPGGQQAGCPQRQPLRPRLLGSRGSPGQACGPREASPWPPGPQSCSAPLSRPHCPGRCGSPRTSSPQTGAGALGTDPQGRRPSEARPSASRAGGPKHRPASRVAWQGRGTRAAGRTGVPSLFSPRQVALAGPSSTGSPCGRLQGPSCPCPAAWPLRPPKPPVPQRSLLSLPRGL